jgi:hypothetical protein
LRLKLPREHMAQCSTWQLTAERAAAALRTPPAGDPAVGALNVVPNPGTIRGTFREHSVNIQGTFREHSGNIQGTFREHQRGNATP